jgi:predicted RNase H-like nuclease (RuvC/YqgF family)
MLIITMVVKASLTREKVEKAPKREKDAWREKYTQYRKRNNQSVKRSREKGKDAIEKMKQTLREQEERIRKLETEIIILEVKLNHAIEIKHCARETLFTTDIFFGDMS